jgi:hypothetical protein
VKGVAWDAGTLGETNMAKQTPVQKFEAALRRAARVAADLRSTIRPESKASEVFIRAKLALDRAEYAASEADIDAGERCTAARTELAEARDASSVAYRNHLAAERLRIRGQIIERMRTPA